MSDDDVVRRYEANVLDTFHKSLAIWSLDRGKAVYALMAAFDTMILPMESILAQITSADMGAMMQMKLWQEGFSQALRWLTADGLVMPITTEDGGLLDKGGDLLTYAIQKYVPVAMMHVAYSRGLAGVEVDEKARLVRFCRLPSRECSDPWSNFADMALDEPKDSNDELQKSAAMDGFYETLKDIPIEVDGGRARLSTAAFVTPELLRLAAMMQRTDIIPLDGHTDLVGFSLDQFRCFWRVLFAWSMGALLIFSGLAHGGIRQESIIPTQSMPLDIFTANISDISGLDTATVSRIVQRLSYTPGNKADIFLQPLLCSAAWIAWSPLVVQLSKEERNALKLMARSPHLNLKDRAANLIGSRERAMLREFGLFLARRAGYSFKMNQVLLHNRGVAELDLLAYTRKSPGEVLLVEGKAILAVDDTGEIIGASSELLRAQEQVRRATEILRTMPLEKKVQIYPFVEWARVEAFYGIVLTPDSYPHHQVDQSEIPFITIHAMRRWLRSRDLRSPSAVWSACRDKTWLAGIFPPIESFEAIKIGDVTYEIPVVGELNGLLSSRPPAVESGSR